MTEITIFAWLTVLSAYSLQARWEIRDLESQVRRLHRRIGSLKGYTSAASDPDSRVLHNHSVRIFSEGDDEET